MNILPITNHILLDITPADKTTDGGIVIPVALQGPQRRQGVIAAIGPDVKNPVIEVGKTLLVAKHRSEDIPSNGRIYRLALEEDAIAIIEP
jgi:co-chaperonin GroES (HSP10)